MKIIKIKVEAPSFLPEEWEILEQNERGQIIRKYTLEANKRLNQYFYYIDKLKKLNGATFKED